MSKMAMFKCSTCGDIWSDFGVESQCCGEPPESIEVIVMPIKDLKQCISFIEHAYAIVKKYRIEEVEDE